MACGIPGIISKHRQFDPETNARVAGRVRIVNDSGLRKLMRAARRGLVPPERMQVIEVAQQSAAKGAWKYLNSCAQKRIQEEADYWKMWRETEKEAA